MLLILRLLDRNLLTDGISVKPNFLTIVFFAILHHVSILVGFDLAVATDKTDLLVGLRKVNQVQIFLELLGFFGLSLSLHVYDRYVLVFIKFAGFLLITLLANDLMLTVNEPSRAHLVVELVWISQLSFQTKLLYTKIKMECQKWHSMSPGIPLTDNSIFVLEII